VGRRQLVPVLISTLVPVLISSLVMLGPASPARAGQATIGLALSGGGARGVAHVGALLALEEAGVPIDLVAGTSMGAIVGGLWAAGYTAQDMQRLVDEVEWKDLFAEGPIECPVFAREWRGTMEPIISLELAHGEISLPTGLLDGQRILEILMRLTAPASYASGGDFDSLAVPFRAMAVDITDGTLLALHDGSLAQALHASMAIPLLFEPAQRQGRLLVDGGVLRVLPTDVVRDMGADIVIGVELERMTNLGEPPEGLIEVGLHTFEIMIDQLKKPYLVQADILIQPDLGGHPTMAYSGLDSLIRLGYEATRARMADILALVPPERLHTDPRQRLDRQALGRARIHAVTVRENAAVREQPIRATVGLQPGERFDLEGAVKGVQRLQESGLFENVWLQLTRPDTALVDVQVHVAERMPHSLDLGAAWHTDLGMAAFVQIVRYDLIGLGERFVPSLRLGEVLSRVGLEVRSDALRVSPLRFQLSCSYEDWRPHLYDPVGRELGRFDFDRLAARAGPAWQIGGCILLRGGAGIERVWQAANPILGSGAQTIEDISAWGELLWDSRDDEDMPHHGLHILLAGRSVLTHARSGRPYTRLRGQVEAALPLTDAMVAVVRGEAGMHVGDAPRYSWFRTGGPWTAPGLHQDELWGRQSLASSLEVRYELIDGVHLTAVIAAAEAVYALEDLTLSRLRSGADLGLRLATPAGPVTALYGIGEGGRQRLYLSLGHTF
jgi:NTE family protein